MDGVFALEQGFIFTAMILAAATVFIIEGRFRVAAGWFAAGAALSATGLMHGWTWTPADTVLHLGFVSNATLGYAVAALILFLAPLLGERGSDAGHG